MTILINRVKDVNGNTRPNLSNISWTVWATSITNTPDEEGAGLTTDGNGALTVPSVLDLGYVMLRINDNDMGLYLAE